MSRAVVRTAGGLLPFSRALAHHRPAVETHGSRTRAARKLLRGHFVPSSGRIVDFFDDDREIKPGVRVYARAATGHHIVVIESGGQTAVFPADAVAPKRHPGQWITGSICFRWTRLLQAEVPA